MSVDTPDWPPRCRELGRVGWHSELMTAGEREAWMTPPLAEALALRRSLADGLLLVVARGAKGDPPA